MGKSTTIAVAELYDHLLEIFKNKINLNEHNQEMNKDEDSSVGKIVDENEFYVPIEGSTMLECKLCQKQAKNIGGMKNQSLMRSCFRRYQGLVRFSAGERKKVERLRGKPSANGG